MSDEMNDTTPRVHTIHLEMQGIPHEIAEFRRMMAPPATCQHKKCKEAPVAKQQYGCFCRYHFVETPAHKLRNDLKRAVSDELSRIRLKDQPQYVEVIKSRNHAYHALGIFD